MDQVLVELVAEEALAQLGQSVLSALQGAHFWPVAQQDVVVGPSRMSWLQSKSLLGGRRPRSEQQCWPARVSCPSARESSA